MSVAGRYHTWLNTWVKVLRPRISNLSWFYRHQKWRGEVFIFILCDCGALNSRLWYISRRGANGMVTRSDFTNVIDSVDAVSLMTYDFSHPNRCELSSLKTPTSKYFDWKFTSIFRPGPNSPIDWVERCVEELVPDPDSPNRQKILLGLNFYGNDYATGHHESVLGPQ